MSQLTSFDRLLAESTFFPGLNVRLAALAPLKRIAERQLDVARESEIERVRLQHAALGSKIHPEDRTFELEDLEQQITHLIPKLTRGGLVLTIWSIFERSVKDIAVRAGDYTKNPVSRRQFHAKFFDTAEQVLLSRANIPAFPDAISRSRLELLASIRHTLIHHDGRKNEAPPNVSALGEVALETLGIKLEHDYDYVYIVPTEAFLDDAVALVYEYVHDLASRVFNALVPYQPE